MLRSLDFDAEGVDLDEDMLAAGRERGFSVQKQDILHYLGGQPNDSFDLVTAFHVIEHVPFEKLTNVVVEVYRVLRPGGLLNSGNL